MGFLEFRIVLERLFKQLLSLRESTSVAVHFCKLIACIGIARVELEFRLKFFLGCGCILD